MGKISWLLSGLSAVTIATAACGSSHSNGSGSGAANAAGSGAANASGSASGGATGNGSTSTSTLSGAGNSGNTGGSTGALTTSGVGNGGGGTCPAYQSCKDLKLNCGSASDGCGHLQDCGTCTEPATCGGGGTQNVCGMPSCTPQTCASLGFNCGSASDQCGGTLSCGTCSSGQTCGAGSANVCGTGSCVPGTCTSLGYDCGMQGDGCGNTISCGTCSGGQVCGGGANPMNGVCGTPVCVPTTCAALGYSCGMAPDGCGNILDCSGGINCPAGEICGGGGVPGVCGGGCSAASQLVYVWDTDNVIHSFDPPTKTFTTIATPDCNASSPNSMAIDRNLVAWLNYLEPGPSGDYIYKFDLTKKTGCVGSGITIPAGYTQVGMGFSTDVPGGSTETLYVDGIGGGGLAKVNMATKTITPIGNFPNDANLTGQSCELTGTGSATLFGYFTTSPYVRVAQLDKTTSDSISDNVLKNFTPPSDWAFSFWGGDFYLYAYPIGSNPTSTVVHYVPSTNTVDLAYIPSTGFLIIGAGVSTCAPTCTAKTCTQAGASCGPAADGCGNIIQCGTCPSGETCIAGACTTGCTAKTCAGQGFKCGMQGDGCGNTLNCGTCPSGQTCNAGTCSTGSCTPKSCSDQNYMCGSVGDGCGNIVNCGSCPAGEICGGMTPGQCYKPPCTPKTCLSLGYNCGQATDGCGAILNCGTCSGSQSCGGGGKANVCGGVN